ncbi:hypothetical protein O6H91_08G113200 [Diphasiastrum complanatum]|uniref:Uncharacterized protein n=1 Tax=Diphasiastrum complanatum TaxID=34168 RepID=A0ACC2D163_DIPCM|nr:hypothetical protein O6H91_08G113200 [Diphasiastrum complanatum]
MLGSLHTGNIKDNSTGDVADDQFHRYKTDVELMKDMNLDAYRLSIGWTRLFPEGRGKKLNQLGVDHYNDVLDTLLKNGLKPYVTLQHFDVPQALEESYGSLLSTQFVEDYANYAEACFETFGDRVKNWITFNEPHIISSLGYARGIFPPQRCSAPFGNCTKGNSSTEPYIVAHHYLLAHATAVAIYRTRFQARQGGIIGITLDAESYEPLRNNSKDVAAVQRARDFELGWFLDPIMFGKYPTSMQKLVGHRLPKFTKEQIRVVKGSIDFIGLNHYSTSYVKALPKPAQGSPTGYPTDSQTLQTAYKNGVAIGSQVNGFNIVPRGIRILVNYVNTRYGDIPIVITENGISQTDNGSLSRVEALHDVVRVNYLKGYLSKLATGIRNGANVKGYFAWSLLDNWEFRSGYTVRYGLYYVDYKKNLTRYPKDSALWYKQFLAHA